jgi:nitrogen regulatory protein PII 1
MIMVQAIVRPEKVYVVLKALLDGGFPAVTKMDVFGRGKQRGLKVGDITYDELSKEMLLIVVKNEDQAAVVNTILRAARVLNFNPHKCLGLMQISGQPTRSVHDGPIQFNYFMLRVRQCFAKRPS